MIRGTTATFKFKLPHKLEHIAQARVVFWQEGYKGTLSNPLPIVKVYYESDFKDVNSDELVVILTSADTKAFTDTLKARVQMKAINHGYYDESGNWIVGGSFGSQPELFTVYPMDEGIMDGDVDENIPTSNEGYVILDGGGIISNLGAGEG